MSSTSNEGGASTSILLWRSSSHWKTNARCLGGRCVGGQTPMAAKNLIANRVFNVQQYEGIGQKDPPRQQVHEVSSQSDIQTQLANVTSIVSQMAKEWRYKDQLYVVYVLSKDTLRKGALNWLRMGDGRARMPLDFQAKISQGMIHIPTKLQVEGASTTSTIRRL